MLMQSFAVVLLNLQSLPARWASASIIVVGIGSVTAVLIGMLAMSQGLRAALEHTSRADRAVVLRNGATSEISSWLTMDEFKVVADFEGVEQASGELFVVIDLPSRNTGNPAVAIGRGVRVEAFELRPELDIVNGRNFEPGRFEMIAGTAAVAMYIRSTPDCQPG